MTLREAGKLLKDAGQKFLDDKATRLAAAIAYYTALSLSPLLLIIIAVASWVFGAEAARGEIQDQIHDLVGEQGAAAIEGMIANSAKAQGGTIAAILGIITLVIGATGVFAQLQDALNSIWKVPQGDMGSHRSGFLVAIRERLLSFSMVCGLAFLLLVSLAVSAGVGAVSGMVSGWVPEWISMVSIFNILLSYFLTTALFALIFKVLPELTMAWRDVWLGAGLTAVLFMIGKFVIGLYLGRSAVGSAYGAAGAFVVLLIWIYYSSIILLYGAELTFLFARRFGSGVQAPDGTPLKHVVSEAVAANRATAGAGAL